MDNLSVHQLQRAIYKESDQDQPFRSKEETRTEAYLMAARKYPPTIIHKH